MSNRIILSKLFLLLALQVPVHALAQDANPTTLTPQQCKLTGGKRIVPNILGFAPEKAKQIIEACDLVYDPETVKTISYDAIGTVGDQQPSGGTVLATGQTVKGFVSAGVFLPDFSGWKDSDAKEFVTQLRHGLTVKEKASDVPEGLIVEQKPPNAVFYNSGEAVELVVSKGPHAIVPDIAGWDYRAAADQLGKLGLVAKHIGGYFEHHLKPILPPCEAELHYPRVTSFKPKGEVKRGSTIEITTEEGIDLVLLPPPKGKTCP